MLFTIAAVSINQSNLKSTTNKGTTKEGKSCSKKEMLVVPETIH